MTESTYTVDGMTCGHCAASVTEEVGKLRGVRTVGVAARHVVVIGETPLPVEKVTHAIEAAGFELAG
jgi:copper chaperone CopZ